MTMDDIVAIEDVEVARERVVDITHETPLDPSTTLANLSGAQDVRLKLENMQRTGSFKARGAYNKLSQLCSESQERGVVTISSGNHAQGVAYAAGQLGIDATVVMPTFTPAAKIEATKGYGADVVIHGETYQELYDRAIALVDRESLTFIHPFDDPEIIAGQGTVGLELVETFPDIDTVLVAVGGGGLISGVATAVESRTDARIVGVETEGSSHAERSLNRGAVKPRSDIDTIAEGIAAGRLGENTLQIIRERVNDLVTVEDGVVSEAVTLLAERANIVTEAAGAATTAALLSGAVDVTDENVVLVVSGGNVDITEFGELTELGLANRGRYVRARLALANWPASLGTVAKTVEESAAELDDVRRESLTPDVAPTRRPVTVALSGTGHGHLRSVLDALAERNAVTVVSSTLDDGI